MYTCTHTILSQELNMRRVSQYETRTKSRYLEALKLNANKTHEELANTWLIYNNKIAQTKLIELTIKSSMIWQNLKNNVRTRFYLANVAQIRIFKLKLETHTSRHQILLTKLRELLFLYAWSCRLLRYFNWPDLPMIWRDYSHVTYYMSKLIYLVIVISNCGSNKRPLASFEWKS